MINKKFLFLMIILINLLAISSVCASSDLSTDLVDADESLIIEDSPMEIDDSDSTVIENEKSSDNKNLKSNEAVTGKSEVSLMIHTISDVDFGDDSLFRVQVSSGSHNVDEGCVEFYVDGEKVGSEDVSNGEVYIEYNAPNAGEFTLLAVFNETENYLSGNASATFTVNRLSSIVSEDDVRVNDINVDLYASLVDSNGEAIVNEAVDVVLDNDNGKTITAIALTDSDGIAHFSFKNLSGADWTYTFTYNGSQNYEESEYIGEFFIKTQTKILAPAVTCVYKTGKYLVITLKDINNNVLSGLKVSTNLNGKTYNMLTDSKGQAKILINFAPKTYTASISFQGNRNYVKSANNAKIVVKKATPKLIFKPKAFRVKVKTKVYTIALRDHLNKVLKGGKVALRVNGKTFTVISTAKGLAAFKITNLKKVGTFKAVITFPATAYYNKVSKTTKLTIIK